MSLAELLTEQRNLASMNLHEVSTFEALRIMNDEDRRVAESITPELPRIAAAVDALVARFQQGGRLFYIGAGTSGRLGVLDASECPPTYGIPSTMVQGIMAGGMEALYQATEASEDSWEAGQREVEARGIGPADAVCGIAASGRTPYVLGAMAAAKARGALTLGISCTPDSELSRAVDCPMAPCPGPEVVTGSTRLKAGTATKLVLNMLTTISMVRLGHVWSNLMINVKPANEKLVARAHRIISQATGVSEARAAQLLQANGLNVRAAIEQANQEKNG